MSDLYIVLFFLGCIFSGWLVYRLVQGQPDLFSSKNFFKTMSTLGFLALGLIVIIGFCILSLQS